MNAVKSQLNAFPQVRGILLLLALAAVQVDRAACFGGEDPPNIVFILVDDLVTSQTRPHSAIRHGDWKLLHFYEDDRVELYDLSTDIAEVSNLAAEQPSLTWELQSKLTSRLSSLDARLPTKGAANR